MVRSHTSPQCTRVDSSWHDQQGALNLLEVGSGQMLLKKPPEIASNLLLVRASDDFENPGSNEAISCVAKLWSELWKIPDTIAGSSSEFVDDTVVTMGEIVRSYFANIVPYQAQVKVGAMRKATTIPCSKCLR